MSPRCRRDRPLTRAETPGRNLRQPQRHCHTGNIDLYHMYDMTNVR